MPDSGYAVPERAYGQAAPPIQSYPEETGGRSVPPSQPQGNPSYQVPKTYIVEVTGVLSEQTLRRLRRGITLEDGPVRPSSVKIISSAADKTLLKITLQEGRNRIVRRTMEAVGHPVRRLTRIGIGPVRLGNLKVGEYRELTREELGGLLDLTGG